MKVNIKPKEFKRTSGHKCGGDNKTAFLKLLAIFFIPTAAINCHADILGLDFSWQAAENGAYSEKPITLGWTFSVTSDIYVTELGVWSIGDYFPNHDPRPIGLWTDSGTLLASQVLTINIPLYTSPLGATIRFDSIQPVELFAGQTYRIGAEYTANVYLDPYVVNSLPPVTSPSVVYGSPCQSPSNAGLSFPMMPNSNKDGIFGPDFMFTPVPEANTANLLLLGLVLIFSGRSAWIFRHTVPPAGDAAAPCLTWDGHGSSLER